MTHSLRSFRQAILLSGFIMGMVFSGSLLAHPLEGQWAIEGTNSPYNELKLKLVFNLWQATLSNTETDDKITCKLAATTLFNNDREILLAGCPTNATTGSAIHHGKVTENGLDFTSYHHPSLTIWRATQKNSGKDKLCVGPFKRQKCK